MFLQYHNPYIRFEEDGRFYPLKYNQEHVDWYDSQELPQTTINGLGQKVPIGDYLKHTKWVQYVYCEELSKQYGSEYLDYKSEINIKGLAKHYYVLKELWKEDKANIKDILGFDYKYEISEFNLRAFDVPWIDLDIKSYNLIQVNNAFQKADWFKQIFITNIQYEDKYHRQLNTLISRLVTPRLKTRKILREVNPYIKPFSITELLLNFREYDNIFVDKLNAFRDVLGNVVVDKQIALIRKYRSEQKLLNLSEATDPFKLVESYTKDDNYWFTILRGGKYYLKEFPPYQGWSRYDYATSSWVVDFKEWLDYSSKVGLWEIDFSMYPYGKLPLDLKGNVLFIASDIHEMDIGDIWEEELGYYTEHIHEYLVENIKRGTILKEMSFTNQSYLRFYEDLYQNTRLSLEHGVRTEKDIIGEYWKECSVQSLSMQNLAKRIHKKLEKFRS